MKSPRSQDQTRLFLFQRATSLQTSGCSTTRCPPTFPFFLPFFTSSDIKAKVHQSLGAYINKSVNGPTLQTMLYSVHTYEVIASYKTIQNYSLNFILSVLEQTNYHKSFYVLPTSKCWKRTLAKVSLMIVGHRSDSTTTSLLSLGHSCTYLKTLQQSVIVLTIMASQNPPQRELLSVLLELEAV